MSILNTFCCASWASVAVDSATYHVPPGGMGEMRLLADPAEIGAGLAARRAMPAPPLRRLLDVEKFLVGRGGRVAIAFAGAILPGAAWFGHVRAQPAPTFDGLAEEAPAVLAGIVAAHPDEAGLIALVAGWSEARGRVVATFFGSADGFQPVEVPGLGLNPWPCEDDPEYEALAGMLGRPVAELRHPVEAHLALARVQVRGFRRNAYGPGMAGGRLWLVTVGKAGVRAAPLADLDEEEVDARPPARIGRPDAA